MCEFHPWRKYMNTKRFGFAGVLAAFALAVSTLVAPSVQAQLLRNCGLGR
jgi:hypothetical protein